MLFALTVAAAEGDDFVGAGATVLLEVGEDLFELIAVRFAEEFCKVLCVFEGHGGSLTGVRGHGVGGVADEDGAAGAPAGEAGDVVDGDVEDVCGRLDESRDGCGPVAVEGEEALLKVSFVVAAICSLLSSGAEAVLHQSVRGPSGVMVLK